MKEYMMRRLTTKNNSQLIESLYQSKFVGSTVHVVMGITGVNFTELIEAEWRIYT